MKNENKAIKSIDTYYGVSKSTSEPPEEWFDSEPVINEQKPYIWSYKVVTFDDDTTSETPKVVVKEYNKNDENSAEDEQIAPAKDDKSKKKTIYIILGGIVAAAVLIFVLFYTHVICFHEWEDATCTQPKTCSICGRTKGKALGHDFTNWTVTKESTCTEEGVQHAICNRCGAGKDKPVELAAHTNGEWQVLEEYVVEANGTVTPGTQILKCSVCEAEIDRKEYTIELTEDQKSAVICAKRWIDGSPTSREYLINDIMIDMYSYTESDATFGADHAGIDWSEQAYNYLDQNSTLGWSNEFMRSMMKIQKFTDEEIDAAFEKAGK